MAGKKPYGLRAPFAREVGHLGQVGRRRRSHQLVQIRKIKGLRSVRRFFFLRDTGGCVARQHSA
jgi:hypothetical protein